MEGKCRLCLVSLRNGPNISIENEAFREQIRQVFKFDIVVDVQLPELVCVKCRVTVTKMSSYLQQVQRNQERLMMQPRENIESLENSRVKEISAVCNIFETEVDGQVAGNYSIDELHGGEFNSNSVRFDSERELSKGENDSKYGIAKQRTGKRIKIGKKKLPNSESVAKRQEDNDQIKQFFNLTCEICASPLENFPQLLEHYREVHATKGYIRCCEKQYFRRYLLLDHISAHRGIIRCEICKKNYKSRRSLALHMVKVHSSEENRPYKCEKCHVSYPKQYLLRAHEMLHIQQQCHVCDKVLSNNQSLKVHISKIHGDDGNHICATCGKLFRTKLAMERHINAHLGLQLVERLQCDYCKKWFNGKYNLRKHIRFLHNEDGQVFKCEICQHVSPNSRALSNHKQRIHVEEKFECEYCGKRFKHRTSLREHIASHTGNPLYSCEICGVTFNSKANYFTHRKNKHPVEWETQRRLRSIKEMSKN